MKNIIGMIHLSGGVQSALDEIRLYEEEGLTGCIIENYHGSLAEVMDVLENINTSINVGINILPNEYETAYYLAYKYSREHNKKNVFIQLDRIAGTYEHVKQFNVSNYFYHRSQFPNIKILGGVLPKYYTPTKDFNLPKALEDAKRLCDAVVVTGEGTGKETPLEKIKKFHELLNGFPLIIGAGINEYNIVEQLEYADGCIIGSAFKPNNDTTKKVDRILVSNIMKEIKLVK